MVMANNKLPVIEGGEDNLDRRSFLEKGFAALAGLTIASTTGLATQVLAGEVGQPKITPVSTKPATFEYVESKLGINYREMAPNPLDAMLSQGELEWMKNAKADYDEDTEGAWKEEIVPQLSKGAISNAAIQELRDYTPQMLQQFAVGLSPQDPIYGYLQSIGTSFVSGRLAGTKT